MEIYNHSLPNNKVIIRTRDILCESSDELLSSKLFKEILENFIEHLRKKESTLLNIFTNKHGGTASTKNLIETYQFLVKMPGKHVANVATNSCILLSDIKKLEEFTEDLYDFWRSHNRFVICHSENGDLAKRPQKTFLNTARSLTDLIRNTYRAILDNLTSISPRVDRQVRAGPQIGAITTSCRLNLSDNLNSKIDQIPVIRQVMIYPPLIIQQPENKRTGSFEKIDKNPLDLVDIKQNEWICYPAKIGKLFIPIYIHEKFFELGFSLCNLFEIADDEDLKKKPDAIYFYGVEDGILEKEAKFPTVYYNDEESDILIGACPRNDKYGYFGYLKKLALTLHNIKIIKNGNMPFHGAYIRFITKKNKQLNLLIMGDTGTGKSESLEAFREVSQEYIHDIHIIADDMGSLEIQNDSIIGFGTEIGAFLRLDDLKPGYAYGQIDKAIIMNPNQVNARIIIPVSHFKEVIKGYPVHAVLYANNYEAIDEEHPIVEKFNSVEEAIKVFKEGTAMSKGTTTSTGLTHCYFANVFGPTQNKVLHDEISKRFFDLMFKNNIFVGQLRTRLGIKGMEQKGPEEAAKELLNKLVL